MEICYKKNGYPLGYVRGRYSHVNQAIGNFENREDHFQSNNDALN